MPRAEGGPVLAAAAVVLGARAGEYRGAMARAIFGVALLVSVVILANARRHQWRRPVAGLLFLAALGSIAMARALAGLGGDPARLAATEAEGRVTLRLAADPQGRWAAIRVPGRLIQVEEGPARGSVLVVATKAAAERLRLLEAGESAALIGRFRPLEARERRWRWRHVGAVLEADDLVGAGPAAPGLLRGANALRHRVLAGGEGLGETDRALVAGFLVGDDRDLPARVAADFRASGLSHLLVVSGANVTLALALVAPLLHRFGLLGRFVGGVGVLILFCAITRFEPSVLRAAAMSGLALLATFLGRPAAGLRLLCLTVAGLVLFDPFLVHSLGFGLSCGASAGILLLAGPLARRLPGPRWIREPLGVTAAAQIGVAPVALPAFGHVPLAALPANVLAAPAAAALSVWGLGSGIAAGSLGVLTGPGGSGPFALVHVPTALLAGWIRTVARLAAQSPLTIGARPAAFVAALIAGSWLWTAIAAGRRQEQGLR